MRRLQLTRIDDEIPVLGQLVVMPALVFAFDRSDDEGCGHLLVGDLIAAEVLQGVRDDREFELVNQALEAFDHIELAGYDIAVKAAQNHRTLRSMGITVRKTIDTLIATRCIEDGLTLLHADRDFLPFAQHLGLKLAYSVT